MKKVAKLVMIGQDGNYLMMYRSDLCVHGGGRYTSLAIREVMRR